MAKIVSRLRVMSIGESLWDIVGGERRLGGAPFNFAYHCHALGAARSRVLTRIGRDDFGALLVERANAIGVSTVLMQTDARFPTGTAEVSMDANGDATYSFRPDQAWDYLEFPDNARRALDRCALVCFGTLAQRSPVSRAAVRAVLSACRGETIRALDLNLRAPHYDATILRNSLELADVVKLNSGELDTLRPIFDLPAGADAAVGRLMERFELRHVVLTKGCEGVSGYSAGSADVLEAPGISVDVKDTIGCGDALFAAVTTQLAVGANFGNALRFGNVVAAYVATQAGATPAYDRETLQEFTETLKTPLAA